MDVLELLTPGRIVCDAAVSSKKRALEMLSGLLAETGADVSEQDIFNGLIARERLGSTGLGHGVAIPHGRFKNVSQAMGAFVRFETAIDFDAIDGEPVDLVFALMVPEESTEEHLQLLASLAEMFSDNSMREQLRRAPTPDDIGSVISHWQSSVRKAINP